MSILAPMKQIGDNFTGFQLERKKSRNSPVFCPDGQATQMIIGASGESDLQILNLTEGLDNKMSLKRVYYSAYIAVNEGRYLPALTTAPPLLREHRLYQANRGSFSMDMTVYLHDGSFEGLLHAVAAAVKSKQGVKGIYAEQGYSPQIFDRHIRIETDGQQALRLFDYLKKLKGSAARYALNGYLSDDRDVEIHLYWMVRECLVRGAQATELYTHDSIRYLDTLSQKVGREAHRLTGLIRFRILEDGLQYAPFEPDCNVIRYCAGHFRKRLKNRQWILHDIR